MVGFFKRRIFRPAYSSVSLGLCFTRLQCGLRAKLGMCRSRKLAVLVQYPPTPKNGGQIQYIIPRGVCSVLLGPLVAAARGPSVYTPRFQEPSAQQGDCQGPCHSSNRVFFSTSISGETGSTSWRLNRRQLTFGVIWTDDTSVHQLVGVDQVLQRIHKDPQ